MSDEKPVEQPSQTIGDIIRKYWFVSLSILGALAITFKFYGDLEYIRTVVNPEAIVEWQRSQAELTVRRSLRWCIGKAVIMHKTHQSDQKLYEDIFRCAD